MIIPIISVFINLETYENEIYQINDFIKEGYDIQTHNYFILSTQHIIIVITI